MSSTDNNAILAQADENSLAELFERDPEHLTDPDIERIVAELRAARTRWEVAERKGTKKVAAPGTLRLEDLGL
jgi:hypothetical protein